MEINFNFSYPLYDDYLIVIVGKRTLTARFYMLSCESCDVNVETPFEWGLNMVTGTDPALTDDAIRGRLSCPCCGASITEKTLVSLE